MDALQARLFDLDTALLTKRCVVRRFRENEGEFLYNLTRDAQDYLYDNLPDFMKQVGKNPAEAEAFVRQKIAAWLLQREFTFGIWDNESTDLIGFLQLHRIDWSIPSAELTYFFKAEVKDQAYHLEVVARILRFAFRQLELEKIYLKILSDSYKAQRVARKVGFNREGDLRGEFRKGSGALVDVMRFGFSRETYGE